MTINLLNLLMLMGVPTICATFFQMIFVKVSAKTKASKQDDQLIKKALQAILRDKLRNKYREYVRAGHIDIADKENYDNMYQIYHTLGTNGVMTDMYQHVMQLPLSMDIPVPKQTSK